MASLINADVLKRSQIRKEPTKTFALLGSPTTNDRQPRRVRFCWRL